MKTLYCESNSLPAFPYRPSGSIKLLRTTNSHITSALRIIIFQFDARGICDMGESIGPSSLSVQSRPDSADTFQSLSFIFSVIPMLKIFLVNKKSAFWPWKYLDKKCTYGISLIKGIWGKNVHTGLGPDWRIIIQFLTGRYLNICNNKSILAWCIPTYPGLVTRLAVWGQHLTYYTTTSHLTPIF